MHTKKLAVEAPYFEALYHTLLILNHPVRIQMLSTEHQIPALILGPYPYYSPNEHTPNDGVSLNLAFVNDLLKASHQTPDPFADSLIFEMICPFKINPDQYQLLAQLVVKLNQLIPLGYFKLPLEDNPSLCYTLKTNSKELDTVLCVEIINSLLFFFEPFANKLEALNLGLIDCDEAIALAGDALEHPDRSIQALLKTTEEMLRQSEIEL